MPSPEQSPDSPSSPLTFNTLLEEILRTFDLQVQSMTTDPGPDGDVTLITTQKHQE